MTLDQGIKSNIKHFNERIFIWPSDPRRLDFVT